MTQVLCTQGKQKSGDGGGDNHVFGKKKFQMIKEV
jgi:hypothetical protein